MRKLGLAVVLISSVFLAIEALANEADESDEILKQTALGILQAEHVKRIALAEFPSLDVAALCMAIGIDHILFTPDAEKLRMEPSDRFIFHIMNEAGKYSTAYFGFSDQSVDHAISGHVNRLSRDPDLASNAIDLCTKKAQRFMHR